MEMEMQMTLKSLCMSYGWSYGVFWRFDPHNHIIIGEAALSGKYRWVLIGEQCQAIDCTSMQVLALNDTELGLQSSSGIKTVAVVPVELRGVMQFGSIKEIAETREFLVQARNFQASQGVAGQNGLLESMNSSLNSFYGDASTPWTNAIENMAGSSVFDMLDAPLGPCDDKSRDHSDASELTIDPRFRYDMFEDAFEAFRTNDLTQWLAESSKLCSTGFDDLSHAMGGDCISSSIQGKETAHSSESSLCNGLLPCPEEKPLVTVNNDELLAEYGVDVACGKLVEPVEDVIGTIGDVHNLVPIDIGCSHSGSISEVDGHPVVASRKGLFSELGLEHLLNDHKGASTNVSYNSSIEDQLISSKKRKFEALESDNGQIQHTNHSWKVKSADLTLKECMPKSQAGPWINESYSMDAKSCISTSNIRSRNSEEPTKSSKKRAKTGESTRPRPKDRQMIADRIKELRDMIPNGAKLSIDALLRRTIKHMVFLQSLKKHSDYLKQVCQPKGNLLGEKDSRRNATWAFEVGGTNMCCPIIVEDLGHRGHMLIEMLCEEQGYFLEIADIVRSFGLSILKGVMEERNDKIWAQFIVEGDRHVTRMDVFVSLMQLLQGTTTIVEPTASDEPAAYADNVDPLWGNYQQHMVPLPI